MVTPPATIAQRLSVLAHVDVGIWDVPGVGLVKGDALTLEYAKLALAFYGAREHLLRRLASRLRHALDADDVGELADLEAGLTGDDEPEAE